jgi:hypothetical protein
MSARIRSLIAAILLCALTAGGVAACNKATEGEAEIGGDAASVVALDGPGHRHRITLTADAAQRIGLETETVRLLPGTNRTAQRLVVPLAAVLYDPDGATWVYAQTAPLAFERARVVVSGLVGDTLAVLRAGPSAGTVVATIGAAELRGSENGVPGE